jgi:hypothetical protein
MKYLFIILLFVTGFGHSAAAVQRAQPVPVIVLAELVSAGSSCDKYCWYTVPVLRTLRGDVAPGTKLRVAALSFEPQIFGKCQLQLTPYNSARRGLWRVAIGTRPVCKDGAATP